MYIFNIMDYYTKYLKYKNKYLDLKKMYGGYVEYDPNKYIWSTEKSDQYSKDEAELFTLLKLKIGHWYSTKLENGNYKIRDNQRYINFISQIPMILFEKAVEKDSITYKDFLQITIYIYQIIENRFEVSQVKSYSSKHQEVLHTWKQIKDHVVMDEIQKYLFLKKEEENKQEEKTRKDKVKADKEEKKQKEIERINKEKYANKEALKKIKEKLIQEKKYIEEEVLRLHKEDIKAIEESKRKNQEEAMKYLEQAERAFAKNMDVDALDSYNKYLDFVPEDKYVQKQVDMLLKKKKKDTNLRFKIGDKIVYNLYSEEDPYWLKGVIKKTNVYDKDTDQIIPYQVLLYNYKHNSSLEWDVKKDDDYIQSYKSIEGLRFKKYNRVEINMGDGIWRLGIINDKNIVEQREDGSLQIKPYIVRLDVGHSENRQEPFYFIKNDNNDEIKLTEVPITKYKNEELLPLGKRVFLLDQQEHGIIIKHNYKKSDGLANHIAAYLICLESTGWCIPYMFPDNKFIKEVEDNTECMPEFEINQKVKCYYEGNWIDGTILNKNKLEKDDDGELILTKYNIAIVEDDQFLELSFPNCEGLIMSLEKYKETFYKSARTSTSKKTKKEKKKAKKKK